MIRVEKDKKGDGFRIEISGVKDDIVAEYMALIEAVGHIEALRDSIGEALDKAVNETEEDKGEDRQILS